MADYQAALIEKVLKLGIDDETTNEIVDSFIEYDKDESGGISNSELLAALNSANIKKVNHEMHQIYQEYDVNQDGVLSIEEFSNIVNSEKNKNLGFIGRGKEKKDIKKDVNIVKKAGQTGHRQIGKGEVRAFSAYLNTVFAKDQQVKDLDLVIDLDEAAEEDGSHDLFTKVQDGVIFCKLVNLIEPNTIPEKAINVKDLELSKVKGPFKRVENLNLGINSAIGIGCQAIGCTHITIREKHENIILGLLWQLIRKNSFKAINLRENADIAALLLPGETLEDLMLLSPEEILLRWVNYHLDKDDAYDGAPLKNFGKDLKDGKAYVALCNNIQPDDMVPRFNYDANGSEFSDEDRAKKVQQMADRLGCGEYITPEDILNGEERVNTLFISQLFNNYPALDKVEMEEEIVDETREEKAFRNWINSMPLGIPQITFLYPPLQGGVLILKLEDAIEKGSVDWKKVVPTDAYKKKGGLIKKIGNCNYALDVAKVMGVKVIGIDGANISDGHQMFILAIVWQLMRKYTLSILHGTLGNVTEREADKLIIEWANKTLADAGKEGFKSFSDKELSDSTVILNLVEAIKPGSVDMDLLTSDNLENARYCLSCCRKIGARVYALPEDIVEVNKKMVMTIFAQLMGCGLTAVNGTLVEGDDVQTHRVD